MASSHWKVKGPKRTSYFRYYVSVATTARRRRDRRILSHRMSEGRDVQIGARVVRARPISFLFYLIASHVLAISDCSGQESREAERGKIITAISIGVAYLDENLNGLLRDGKFCNFFSGKLGLGYYGRKVIFIGWEGRPGALAIIPKTQREWPGSLRSLSIRSCHSFQ